MGGQSLVDSLQDAGLAGSDSATAAAAAAATGHMLLASVIPDDLDPAKLGLFALAGLGVAAAGFSTAVYWRMQYVVSAPLVSR